MTDKRIEEQLAANLRRDLNPWRLILERWQQKREVDKAAVVRLLESGEPVIVEANALLAGLLDGTMKATRGNKRGASRGDKLPDLRHVPIYQRIVSERVQWVESLLKDPAKIDALENKEQKDKFRALRMRGTGTENQKAKAFVAQEFGEKSRTIDWCIEQHNRTTKSGI